MNEREYEGEAERKKFEEEYLLSKKPIEYIERLKREFDRAMFKVGLKKFLNKERGVKGDGGGP